MVHFYNIIFLISAYLLINVYGYPQDNTTRTPITDEAIEATLNDRRYLMRQLKCALGEVSCDPVGRKLKSLAPYVLRGSCPQCTPQEIKQVRKVLLFVQKNYPKEWNKMLQKYNS